MTKDKNSNNICPNPIEDIEFVSELQDSYIQYAVSVISTRAIPDLRDGLKTVQRRIIFGMYESKNNYNHRFRKCAQIIGAVSGKYHPHGEVAIYDTLVRMAQPFNTYMPLIESQGNFGSIDGDEAAAHRYTEARLSKIADFIISDLDYDIVTMNKTYDGSELEPEYLPFKLPISLINGSSGIAVCFSSCIPSHSIHEVINALKHILNLDNIEDVTNEDLLQIIKGPDFPTKCIIHDCNISDIYTKGFGKVTLAAIMNYDEKTNSILIEGVPYGVKKLNMIKSIYDAMKNKVIIGIKEIIDESSLDNQLVQLVLDKSAQHAVIINRLVRYTECSTNIHCHLRCIVDKKPIIVSISKCLVYFINMRIDIIKKRLKQEIMNANKSVEKNLALLVATETKKIIELISTIIKEETLDIAREKLKNIEFNIIHISHYLPTNIQSSDLSKFKLSALQIEYLLSLPISRLNKEKTNEFINIIKKKTALIQSNLKKINSEQEIKKIIISELDECEKIFNKKRVCEIKSIPALTVDNINLYPVKEILILLCKNNQIFCKDFDIYRIQNRGGKGKGLYINNKLISAIQCSTHTDLIVFTKMGYVYKVKMVLIYYNSISIDSIINIREGDEIISISEITKLSEYKSIIIITNNGYIKKHSINIIKNTNKGGKRICNLHENDFLCRVLIGNSDGYVSIFTSNGRSITLALENIREFSNKTTIGMKSIKLKENDEIKDATLIDNLNKYIMIVSSYGYGKILAQEEIKISNRNTIGNLYINKKHGTLSGVVVLNKDNQEENILIVTESGKIILFEKDNIPITFSRRAKGVRLINLKNDNDQIDTIIFISKV